MALSDTAEGYIAVAVAILFFGSFAIPLKLPSVQRCNVDPMVFQCYYSLAVCISSWLILIIQPFSFSWLGTAGAALWVPVSVLAISAINFMGMATAQGIWSGITILISFMWGAFVFGEEIKEWSLTVLGLELLIIAIAGISICNLQAPVYLPPQLHILYRIVPFFRPLGDKSEDFTLQTEENNLLTEDGEVAPPKPKEKGAKDFLFGLACACVLGVLNGSMMVPTQFLPEDAQGLGYVVSFTIGVAIVTVVLAPIYFGVKYALGYGPPQFHVRHVAIPGFVAGLIWNVGNIASIVATKQIGLTIGFPLTQCALVVGGIWGMVLFKEITRIPAILAFFASVVLLLTGAALLSFFG